jgi:hypothetical protein
VAAASQLKKLAEREYQRRAASRTSTDSPWDKFRERTQYHAPQRELVDAIADMSPEAARLITELASRQSGKSFGAGGGALELGEVNPGCNIVYIAATFDSCERMGFKPAKALADTFKLGCRVTDMQIETPSGCTIYFLGANTEKFIDRLRGIPNLVAAIIDECGIYKSNDLKTMVDTLMPGLRPRRGKLVLMGTPSKGGKLGTWYQAIQNAAWLHLKMSYRDNDRVPSFAEVEKLIDEELSALGYTRESAYFLREYGNEDGPQFVVDATEKVYELTDANLVDELPEAVGANVVTGGDIGERANDALLSFDWEDAGTFVYLREEIYARGQDSIAFADMVHGVDQRFAPIEIATDPGGLGAKSIMTTKKLYPGCNITEARKGPVVLQVRALNQLLRGGRLKMLRTSRLAADLSTPTWDISPDGVKTINEHGQHSDGAPAARYAAQVIIGLLPSVDEIAAAVQRARDAADPKVQRLKAAQKRERHRSGNLNDDDMEETLGGDGDDFEPMTMGGWVR